MKKDNIKSYTRMLETWSPTNLTSEFETLEETRDIYNQINYRNPMHVSLFTYVLENIIKVNRSIQTTLPGTIILAQEGCAADKIAKLA